MKYSTKEIILCAIFASIISILAQISIPLPFTTVPLTMLIFGVSLTGLILGARLGVVSVLVYLLIGAIGMPVFSQFSGGISVLFGSTGGYLLGLLPMVYIIGFAKEKFSNNIIIFISLIIGLISVYITGTLMFSLITGNTIYQSLLYCVLPFILVDILKLILAFVVGLAVSKRVSSSLIYNKSI